MDQTQDMQGESIQADETSAHAVLGKFRIIFGAIRQHFREVEKACGVSGAQVWVLATLDKSPGLRVTELAEALSIHASTASNLLDKIERSGLIRRERGTQDQRVVRLFLTEGGRAALAAAPQPFTGVLPHALDQLAPEILARLNQDLDTLIGHMDLTNSKDARRPLSEL